MKKELYEKICHINCEIKNTEKKLEDIYELIRNHKKELSGHLRIEYLNESHGRLYDATPIKTNIEEIKYIKTRLKKHLNKLQKELDEL